jgi:spermidine/putrescine transport system substrate-binding protein
MRKVILILCVCMLVIVLAAPSLAQDATPAATPEGTMVAVEPWVCPDGYTGQSLHVYNWTTYVAEDTISNFEKACGVTVVYDTYESNEAMIARLRQGNPGYDIVVPTDYAISQMIGLDLLEPLDMTKIPNFANVSPQLQDPPYDPGNKYSVPYQWGTVGIGYNTDKVGHEVTSWNDLFDYTGNVAWLDDQRAMLAIALNLLSLDPNTASADDIGKARDFLIAHGSNVKSIAADDGQAQLERGDVDMTIEYSGDIFQVMADCNCTNIQYVIPSEGTNLWVDNLAIPKDAPNAPLANVFIDYILHPQVGADISNYTAYGSPNQAAIDDGLIDPTYASNPSIYPTKEVMDRLYFIADVPEAGTAYQDAWDEVKIGLGQS